MNSSHSTPLSISGPHPLLSRFAHPFAAAAAAIPPPLEKTLMSATNPYLSGAGVQSIPTGLAQNRYMFPKQASSSSLQATPKTYGGGHQYLGSYGAAMDTTIQSLINNDFLVARSDISSSQPNLLSHSHLRRNHVPGHNGIVPYLSVPADSPLPRQNSLSSSNFHGRESQLDLYKQHRLASDALARQNATASSDPALYNSRKLLIASEPYSHPDVQKMLKKDQSNLMPAVAAATAQTLAIQDFYNIRRSDVPSVYQPHKTQRVPGADYHSGIQSSANPKHQITDAIKNYYAPTYNSHLVKQKQHHHQHHQQTKQQLQQLHQQQTQQKHHQSASYAQIQARYAAYAAQQHQQSLSFAATSQGSQAWSTYSSKTAPQVNEESVPLLTSLAPSKYTYDSYDHYSKIKSQQTKSLMTSPLTSKTTEMSSLKKGNSSTLLVSKNHYASPNVQVKAIPGTQNRQIITEVSKPATVPKPKNNPKCSVIMQKPPMPQLIHKDHIASTKTSKAGLAESSEVPSKNKNFVPESSDLIAEDEKNGIKKQEDESLEPLDLSLTGDKQKDCEHNEDDVLCLDDHISGVNLPKKTRKSYIEYEKPNTSSNKTEITSNFVSPAVSPASITTKDTRLASIDDVIRNALASADISNLINPVNFEKHWMRARQRLKDESNITSSCQAEFQNDHLSSCGETETYHNRLDLQKNLSSKSDDILSISKHLNYVPPAVPCHVLNIAPDIELQDDSMHQVNLVEVKRVPNIHQFGWPRYKNKSKQTGHHSSLSNNADVTKVAEANNSRRPFSIIKFKTDKAMRTDNMAESMLVWTADSTQPYLVKPVVTPSAPAKKCYETEDRAIISSSSNKKNNNSIINNNSDNNPTTNKKNNNNDDVDDTIELAPVLSPETAEESQDVVDPSSSTSSFEEKRTTSKVVSDVSRTQDSEIRDTPKTQTDSEQSKEPPSLDSTGETFEVPDSSETQESGILSQCRESISLKSSNFEFQDDEAPSTSSSDLEKRPNAVLVKIPTRSSSPEMQKGQSSPKVKHNKFSIKTSPKNRNFASSANGSYQNFFHKLKPDKVAAKNLKKYQKASRSNSYSSIVTDSLSEQIAKVKRKLEMDLFGSDSKSIQLKQILPRSHTEGRPINSRVKKESSRSHEIPSREYHTPPSHSPEPRTSRSRSPGTATDVTNSSKDTPSDFLNNYNVETFPQNGNAAEKGEKIRKVPSTASSKSFSAKNSTNESETGKCNKKEVKGPQICSTREKKKTIPFDEKESEEIGIFLTPKALKAQQQMLEYYKKKNMQREGRLTRARASVVTSSAVSSNRSSATSSKNFNRSTLRESMAQFSRKRKLQEAKKPVRAYSTYKSLRITNKKEHKNSIEVDTNEEAETETIAAKYAKADGTSGTGKSLKAEPSQSESPQVKDSGCAKKLPEESSNGGARLEEMQSPNQEKISSSSGTSDFAEQTTSAGAVSNSFSECSQNNGMSHLLQNPEFNIDTENMRIKISLEFKQHNRVNQLANSSTSENSLGSTTANISSVTISQASSTPGSHRNSTTVSASKKNVIISKNVDSSESSSSNSQDRLETATLEVKSSECSSTSGNTVEQVVNETAEKTSVVVKTEVKDEFDQMDDDKNWFDDKIVPATSSFSKSDSEPEPSIPPELKSIKLNRKLGETWMHRAAITNSETIFDYAMKLLGPEGVNGIDMAGRNPLHLAAMNNNVKIARKLIQHGASVNKPNTVNGTTCLHEAVISNSVNMIQFLLAHGADLSQRNFMGATVSETENLSKEVDYFVKAAIYDRYRASKIDSCNLAANFNPFVLSEEELKDEGMSDWDDDVKMSEMVHFNETLPSVVATTSEAATEIAEKTLIN